MTEDNPTAANDSAPTTEATAAVSGAASAAATATTEEPTTAVLTDAERVTALEADLAYLRKLFGWPTA